MNVLLIGSGGREHAWRGPWRKPGLNKAILRAGKSGIEAVAGMVPIPPPTSRPDRLAKDRKIGSWYRPEAPLVAGLADRFEPPGSGRSAQRPGARSWRAPRPS